MRSLLVFLLVNVFVLAGLPSPFHAETTPQTLSAKEKAALTVLSNPGLLQQKAGDGQVDVNGQKVVPKSDVGSTGAALVTAGSALIVLFCSLIGNISLVGGGSC